MTDHATQPANKDHDVPGSGIAALLAGAAWIFAAVVIFGGIAYLLEFGSTKVAVTGLPTADTVTDRRAVMIGIGIIVHGIVGGLLLGGFASIVKNVGHIRRNQR